MFKYGARVYDNDSELIVESAVYPPSEETLSLFAEFVLYWNRKAVTVNIALFQDGQWRNSREFQLLLNNKIIDIKMRGR